MASSVSEQVSDLHHKLLQKSKELGVSPQSNINLSQKYSQLKDSIKTYTDRINSKDMDPATKSSLIVWLGKAATFIKTEEDNFNKVTNKTDSVVVKNYSDRADKVKTKLDAFDKKWNA